MLEPAFEHNDMPITIVRAPRIRELTHRQMEFVLSRNHVGRVAFLRGGRIELQPVHYVFTNSAIYGRIAFGVKYRTWLDGTDIVFEVDEPEALFDWRSVIVRGTVTLLPSLGDAEAVAEYDHAVSALRSLVANAFTVWDPTPHRSSVFRITPTQLSGREAVSR